MRGQKTKPDSARSGAGADCGGLFKESWPGTGTFTPQVVFCRHVIAEVGCPLIRRAFAGAIESGEIVLVRLIGCALGGSKQMMQDIAKALSRGMGATGTTPPSCSRHYANPVDAAFLLNGHMTARWITNDLLESGGSVSSE